MSFTDTSPEMQSLQTQAQGRLTGEQRLLTAWEMSVFVREMAKAGIRKEHPEWSENEIVGELIRRAFLPGEAPADWR
ncbi:MAG: hypothetical protein WBV55_15130 [Candidatus Sulfotelmatobacter sp.]